ncbi:MAG: type II toxin-antitoxin system prevent-host-death family antitoxin [Chthoniobacterales bacterium]|nr:type II toxin-antitoxin system prevent-host-death family antitoxin [Chthoniobacterales bacterium]
MVLFFNEKSMLLGVADSYTVKAAQQQFFAVVRDAADHPVTITKQGKAVAVMMSIERMEALAETMEILADPAGMKAIREHREERGVGSTRLSRAV